MKGVEGLPLKYLIIALVATLVIAIIVSATGVLGTGVNQSVSNITNYVTNATSTLG